MAAANVETVSARPGPAPSLTDIIASYAILPTLASWLSTVDLYHLALTNRSHFAYILASKNIFKTLTRQSLCDGHGLADRQELRRLYTVRGSAYVWGDGRKIHDDEEIEVRLYNLKCDEAGALPCVKCGVNICEECRFYPRVPTNYVVRRPHLNAAFCLETIMCMCQKCDAKTEEELSGKFLNELCDCDVFKRWVCTNCVQAEARLETKYYKEHTALEWEWGESLSTKVMGDHQFERALWCWCGASVPSDTRPRCLWCKRRHLPENQWYREWQEIGSKAPFFDNDPCYPRWVVNQNGEYPQPYPELEYGRIINSRSSDSHAGEN